MTEEELEEIIEKARIDRATKLDLSGKQLTSLPESIGNLSDLSTLLLYHNNLTSLPDSIGNLFNLTYLNLWGNKLVYLPESINRLSNLNQLNLRDNYIAALPEDVGRLDNLCDLNLNNNKLATVPESIGNMLNLSELDLGTNLIKILPENIGCLTNLHNLWLRSNQLTSLPLSIGYLSKLKNLCLNDNQIKELPSGFENLSSLVYLGIVNNPIINLHLLQNMPELCVVEFLGYNLPRRYWSKFSEWEPKWLLNEENAEIRRVLIQQIGYERICDELEAVEIDSWREYRLLRIDGVKTMYRGDDYYTDVIETLVFLKMTCPSTGHIHILRVPPEMTSAEAAITWVNHGIHPDEFTVQT